VRSSRRPARACQSLRVFRGDQYSTWARRRSLDRFLVQDICAELLKYDIWCAHNGRYFDVPFLRTRLARWQLPPLPTRKLIDPLLLARNKFRMSYNSLESLARMLNRRSPTLGRAADAGVCSFRTGEMSEIAQFEELQQLAEAGRTALLASVAAATEIGM
jgi:hypothetical protein